MKDYCVELKVCEGCGALFLRAAKQYQGSSGRGCHGVSQQGRGPKDGGRTRTCQGCSARFAEFPAPRERRRRGWEVRSVRRCSGVAATVGGAR
jgi:hypothetical protein